MSQQNNGWKPDLVSFMVEKRLLPQFEKACEKFSARYGTSNEDATAFQSMGAEIFERARDVLGPLAESKPSLLHGGGSRSRFVFRCVCFVMLVFYGLQGKCTEESEKARMCGSELR